MGRWEIGDYAVLIPLDTISIRLRRDQQSIQNAIDYYGEQDTNLVNYYKATSIRYALAATQIEQAKNGFDLRSLVIYDGIDNPKQQMGNSRIIEYQIKQLVNQGTAIVLFKGERIFTLHRISESSNGGRTESISDLLNWGYEIKIYYNEQSNCLFIDYYHMGW
jgi:hypothetical protein